MKKTPSEENSLPLPLACVCVCVCVCVRSFKNLTLSSECALLRVKKRRRRTKKSFLSSFSLRQTCQNQKERKNKERLQNNALIIS